MIIYIWEDGYWEYDWEQSQKFRGHAKKVDLNSWYDYNLTEQEVLACLEALEE